LGFIVENSIKYIKENFPEVEIKCSGQELIFIGRFIIKASYKDVKIDIAPKLKIRFPKNYPNSLPLVYEQNNKYMNEHVLIDNALCVATEFDQIIQLSKSDSIKDFVEKFLIPYFISYQSKITTNEYIFGDREHGLSGIYQSIADFFKLSHYDENMIKTLMLWSIKKKPFYKVIPDHNLRRIFTIRFSLKIGLLRKSGIVNLKRFYKNFETQKEFMKMYYQYMNSKVP
jgi:hypothetical protein